MKLLSLQHDVSTQARESHGFVRRDSLERNPNCGLYMDVAATDRCHSRSWHKSYKISVGVPQIALILSWVWVAHGRITGKKSWLAVQ